MSFVKPFTALKRVSLLASMAGQLGDNPSFHFRWSVF